jgi:hypothetical protein
MAINLKKVKQLTYVKYVVRSILSTVTIGLGWDVKQRTAVSLQLFGVKEEEYDLGRNCLSTG